MEYIKKKIIEELGGGKRERRIVKIEKDEKNEI